MPGHDFAVCRVVIDDEDPLANELWEILERDLVWHLGARDRQRDPKVEPLPCSLSTECSAHQIHEPLGDGGTEPRPPNRRVIEASTWLNDVKSLSIRSGGIPIPVS